MGILSGLTWPVILAFGNLILSSAIVITAFSLLGYMISHNLRSTVAQTFGLLLACVLIVFSGDIIVPRVESHDAAVMWLRVQWIGIAMLPAAYLHFSDAVLRTTHHYSNRRRLAVIASYVVSGTLVGLALFTDLLVTDGEFHPPLSHLGPGPIFPVFVVYFFLTAIYGAYNVYRARRRSLTRASRRRMTYLTLSFAAPGLGVFPYLIYFSLSSVVAPVFVLLLAMAANVVVGMMLVLMAYSVAYYGVLSPDRVIKHDLMHYLLRGPIVGILVIIVMLVMPRVELILGLPRDTALIFAVVGVIVIGQVAANLARPWIERLIYSQDREEITWIQALEHRLLTSSDLEQFLGNLLAGLCELLRVDTGFVLVQTKDGFQVEARVGSSEAARKAAASPGMAELWQALAAPGSGLGVAARPSSMEGAAAGRAAAGRATAGRNSNGRNGSGRNGNGRNGQPAPDMPRFYLHDHFWYWPLRSQDGEKMLGVLAAQARGDRIELRPADRTEADALLTQAAAALADRYMQESIFETLQRLMPDLERIQEWRSALRFMPPAPPIGHGPVEPSPRAPWHDETWEQGVKDALSHYWGGPKLTENPLIGLNVVRKALKEQDGSIPRAIRAVLHDAIERQRPEGERKLTASEWLLYNILDLRFVQGERVRDIAARLAISESDLYRKQRVAVAEVAKTLADMEAEASAQEDGDRSENGGVTRG